jgi:hypothetical protein
MVRALDPVAARALLSVCIDARDDVKLEYLQGDGRVTAPGALPRSPVRAPGLDTNSYCRLP